MRSVNAADSLSRTMVAIQDNARLARRNSGDLGVRKDCELCAIQKVGQRLECTLWQRLTMHGSRPVRWVLLREIWLALEQSQIAPPKCQGVSLSSSQEGPKII